MKRLSQEVRGSFNNADEITVKALSQLPYLTAAINETLRMYPPVTSDLIRVIPPEGKNIAGHYVTGGVSAHSTPSPQYAPNLNRHTWRSSNGQSTTARTTGLIPGHSTLTDSFSRTTKQGRQAIFWKHFNPSAGGRGIAWGASKWPGPDLK